MEVPNFDLPPLSDPLVEGVHTLAANRNFNGNTLRALDQDKSPYSKLIRQRARELAGGNNSVELLLLHMGCEMIVVYDAAKTIYELEQLYGKSSASGDRISEEQ